MRSISFPSLAKGSYRDPFADMTSLVGHRRRSRLDLGPVSLAPLTQAARRAVRLCLTLISEDTSLSSRSRLGYESRRANLLIS
jgi:hypothetical protein